MFRVTGNKKNINVKECIASTEAELPGIGECLDKGIGLGSTAFIVDTAEAAILDEEYIWIKI